MIEQLLELGFWQDLYRFLAEFLSFAAIVLAVLSLFYLYFVIIENSKRMEIVRKNEEIE